MCTGQTLALNPLTLGLFAQRLLASAPLAIRLLACHPFSFDLLARGLFALRSVTFREFQRGALARDAFKPVAFGSRARAARSAWSRSTRLRSMISSRWRTSGTSTLSG